MFFMLFFFFSRERHSSAFYYSTGGRKNSSPLLFPIERKKNGGDNDKEFAFLHFPLSFATFSFPVLQKRPSRTPGKEVAQNRELQVDP